jgi:hypothetical protein
MNEMTILPTGTCFDDVLDQQSFLVTVNPDLADRQFIVHGICTASDGHLFSHAWVEDDDGDRVFQSGILNGEKVWFGLNRSEWYDTMQIQKFTRYTFMEALMLNYQTHHYGPWVDEYRTLCKKSCN